MEQTTPQTTSNRQGEPTTATPGTPVRRRVRVWFGRHAICTHIDEAEPAHRYAALMRRRFAGLRVTTETITSTNIEDPDLRATPTRLPADPRLWPLTIR